MKKLILIFFSFLFLSALQAQVVINPCARATTIHIVVIGSSTAAGTGPTNSANAWVNRYRDYIQSINPSNQVTNLAVGGTTTYHIMPDWFVPAISGRPSVNPAKNVSQAISLGADAIIVNMPSNDAANGFGVSEQMFNFQMISSVADSAGIPVWVCTTQPKNFSAVQKAIQIAVRDSINSFFGPKAIDFWTGFADATNGLATFYDSGDGTHMNDTAHAELFARVYWKGIPNEVTDTLGYTDHALTYFVTDVTTCGEYSTMYHAVVTNLGQSSLATDTISINYLNIPSNIGGVVNSFPVNQLGACLSDTFSIQINSYFGTNQKFYSYLTNSADSIKTNDSTDSFHLQTIGHPTFTKMNDTVPSGGTAILSASTAVGDTLVWYDSAQGGSILSWGNQYTINNLTNTQVAWVEAVRGPLHYIGDLFTVTNTTTDWNGMMFDIVAHNNILIDSLEIKVNTTGQQNVVCYNRQGSLVGNEMNSSAWTYWGLDNVNATNPGEFEIVRMPTVSLNTNDTLGVYVHMQNGASQLSYLNSSATTYSNNELSIINGTGVTHTFGITYSPRNWSGRVYYHYGFNPQGQCHSTRLPVLGVVQWPQRIDNFESIGLKVYPNPSNGIIHFEGDKIPEFIMINDLQGRTIKTANLKLNQIDLSSLQMGLYFLVFEMEGKRFAQKILLE